MNPAQTAREIALVRSSPEPGRRAFAAAALATGDVAGGVAADDPVLRMFGFGTRHDRALPWDGRSTRSGTITYADEDRVEQYVGAQQWVAYERRELGLSCDVGDQVRIARRGDAVAVDAIGPNRLRDGSAVPAREVSSGLVVLRTAELRADEIASYAASVAERYDATLSGGAGAVRLDFRGAAQLLVATVETEAYAAGIVAELLDAPIAGAVRVAVSVQSQKLDAAAGAERALMLMAAMLASEDEAIAVDDGGAIFCAEDLTRLATRNEMRADAFAFAAAAAQRQAPPHVWFSDRTGMCDELTVFSSRPWRAAFAARMLERQLRGLFAAANDNADPVVPTEFRPSPECCGAGGDLEPLASLACGSVEIDIAFIDVTRAGADVRARIDARPDVAAMLAGPVASAVVIAFGSADPEPPERDVARDMRRAETIATALAAAFAQRGESIATDVRGALYGADELVTLALRRSGKSASWAARVAALADDRAVA